MEKPKKATSKENNKGEKAFLSLLKEIKATHKTLKEIREILDSMWRERSP